MQETRRRLPQVTRLAAVVVVSASLAGLIVATAASAGEYHVYACHTPAGEAAPVDGWSGSAGPGGAWDDFTVPAGARMTGAHLTLRVTPHAVGRNQSVHFSGRLEGGSIPRGGKQLVLEGRLRGGRWLKFDVIRTGARGRFHASYRFTFLGPGRWQIRVLCEVAADYPFAAGWSNVVRVRVG